MEYDAQGHVKLPTGQRYPVKLYFKGGNYIDVYDDAGRDAALAAGGSFKVWDREKHAPGYQPPAPPEPIAPPAELPTKPAPEPEPKSDKPA